MDGVLFTLHRAYVCLSALPTLWSKANEGLLCVASAIYNQSSHQVPTSEVLKQHNPYHVRKTHKQHLDN